MNLIAETGDPACWVKAEAIATLAIAGISLFGVIIAWWQLSKIKKSIDMASLMAILEVETQMNDRKVWLDKCNHEVRLAKHQEKSNDILKILADQQRTAKENYLNSLDRLSFCILREYFSDKELRTEYRNMLQSTIQKFENDFGAGSQFRNMKKLNSKWQDE